MEKAQYAEFNVPTCGKIAVWQLCRERQPFWNSQDGLNFKCLDQCHGVRWLTPKNCLLWPKVIVVGSPRESFLHAFVDISVFPWLRTKILPRLAQGLFWNERTWKNHWSYCPNEWKVEKAESQHAPKCAIPCQHGPTLQFDSCAEKDSFLEQSWWPEFDMFGSMPCCSFPWHKLLPRLAQKNCHTTVWIWSMSSHLYFRRRWLLQVSMVVGSGGVKGLVLTVGGGEDAHAGEVNNPTGWCHPCCHPSPVCWSIFPAVF